MLSDQVGPILANGAKGNPRQIKRFLNMLLLRQRTADARGFGEEIQLSVLGKLMLAERFLPSLFDQIATIAATHPQIVAVAFVSTSSGGARQAAQRMGASA